MGCCASKRAKNKISGWVDGVDKDSTHSTTTELASISKKSIITASTQNVPNEITPIENAPTESSEQSDAFKPQTKVPGALVQDGGREGMFGYTDARVVMDNLFSSEEDLEHAAIIQSVVRAHLARKHKRREQENFSILRAPLLLNKSQPDSPQLLIPQVPAGSVKTKSQVPRGARSGTPGMITSSSLSGLRGQLTFNPASKAHSLPQAPD